MANQTSSVSMDTRDLGALLCGPICRPYYASPNKVCLLASGSWRYPYGCVYDDVDQMAEPLHQSSLESNRQSTEQDLARTITSGDPGGSLLAQRDLVSPVEIFGNSSSSVPQQERYTGDDNINPSPSPQELEALRLEIISNKYSKNGLNDNATRDLLQPLLEPTATNRGYRKNQLRFLAWATAHNVSPTMFTGADVVNFLARLKHDHKLQLGTLKSIRTAIAHLHDDSRSISSHPLINTYLDSIAKQAPPMSIHKPQVDLTPSMVYARSIPSCFSTSVSLLQQKLAFLLAMAAFLRPSDLARIPFDSCKVTPSDGCLHFKVVSPKERRKKRKIVKDFRVHPHQDKELCPAFCFTILKDHPRLQGRTRHSALFVKANKFNQPVLSSTISSWLHRRFISLSTTEPHVSIRSLASSAALDKGVDLQDIVTLGNWTSSDTFRQHYQRNHMADVNFTNTVLDHAVKDMEIFYDAEEDWTLD
ncbi:hypothetical protein G6F28_012327 [Rhizopus arrhizus]|nr:hypothetical protein G6F28_012327 [Rhizopus arrhizus]